MMSQYAIFRLATTVFGEDQKEAKLWLERLDELKRLEEGEQERLKRLEEGEQEKLKRLEEGGLERKEKERLEE